MASNSSAKRAFGNTVNQSLLDDLLCLSRVVVPMARCFSSDSYGGSVTTRSTELAGRDRSHATASVWARSKETFILATVRVLDDRGQLFSAVRRGRGAT